MIAADSSSLVAYLSGMPGRDVDLIASAMASGQLALPPAVLTELLTDPGSRAAETQLANLILLDLTEGHWWRAGLSRRHLQRRGLKAKVADALIAQCCIDHDVALITRDKDFRHFAKHCGLKLA